MRKFTVQLDERCWQLLWRRGGQTWKSRLAKGRLSERLHYAFCVPWNENKAVPGAGSRIGERTVDLLIPDKIAPGGQHHVTWLFERDIPPGLVIELSSMNRKPWRPTKPGAPADPSRKRRKHRKKVVTEETQNA